MKKQILFLLCMSALAFSCKTLTSKSFNLETAKDVTEMKAAIYKHLKPDMKVNEARFNMKYMSGDFTTDAEGVTVQMLDKDAPTDMTIDCKMDTVGMKENPIYKNSDFLKKEFIKDVVTVGPDGLPFDQVPVQIANAVKMIDSKLYEFRGIGNYTLKPTTSTDPIKHSFVLQVTKVGEGTKRTGRMVETTYYELKFEVDAAGKMTMTEE
jgi:hypothetical protein